MLQCDDYLEQCKNNLQEANDITDENLDELNSQREILLNVNKNLNNMNTTLDESEITLHKIKNPFCCFNIIKKNKRATIDFSKKKILMFGIFKKRSKVLKNWNKRYYELYDNYLIYRHKKKTNKKYIIELTDANIYINLYNKIYKDHSLSIDDNYFFFDKQDDFLVFVSLIKKGNITHYVSDIVSEVNPWESNIYSNKSKHNILDDINENLDNIYYKNILIRNELEDQNRIITDITKESDNTNTRLIKNSNVIKSIN